MQLTWLLHCLPRSAGPHFLGREYSQPTMDGNLTFPRRIDAPVPLSHARGLCTVNRNRPVAVIALDVGYDYGVFVIDN